MNRRPYENSKIAIFLRKRIGELGIGNLEVMARGGLTGRQQIVSMWKNGNTKVALERVPALAKALEVDPAHLLRLALEQHVDVSSHPDVELVISSILSENERKILQEIRRDLSGNVPPLSAAGRATLASAFRD